MNKKAEKFQAYLDEKKINWFNARELKDDFQTVVFDSRLEAAAQTLPVIICLDESIFSFLRLIVAGPVAEDRRESVKAYLNELNAKFKIFKYYLDPSDNTVYMDISVPCIPDEFNPELLVYTIGEILLPHVEEYLPQIMNAVWGKDAAKGEAKDVKAEKKPAAKK